MQRLSGGWTTVKGKIDSLRSEIEEHENLLKQAISKCPTCGQNIKPASMRRMLKADNGRIEVLRREEDRRQQEYETENAKLETGLGAILREYR